MPGISAVSPPISAQPACSQPRGDALDHRGRDVDVELAAREVVEEEQRLGALHEDVVDAHRDEVDADRVVAVERERELELGADAVGAGDQHRLAEALADLDQRAEAADAGEHLGAQRALGERLDALDQRVAGVDVDAGVAVGKACEAGGAWESGGGGRADAADEDVGRGAQLESRRDARDLQAAPVARTRLQSRRLPCPKSPAIAELTESSTGNRPPPTPAVAAPKRAAPRRAPPRWSAARNYLWVAGAALVVFLALRWLGPVLTPFLIGAILAYLGTPLVDRGGAPRHSARAGDDRRRAAVRARCSSRCSSC